MHPGRSARFSARREGMPRPIQPGRQARNEWLSPSDYIRRKYERNEKTNGRHLAVAGLRAPVVPSLSFSSPPPLAGEGRVGARSGRGDRCPWIDQVEPGQSGGKVHHLAIGTDDLQRQLGVRQVPGGRVAVAPGEDIRRTGPLEVEVDSRRTVDVGEAGIVM